MEREILFQGKRLDDGRWVDGFYVQHWVKHCNLHVQEFKDAFLKHYIMRDGNVHVRGAEPPWVPVEVDPNTVRQYSGYNDKDTRRIFEGDIVEVKHDGNDGFDLLVVAHECGRWEVQQFSSIDYMMENGWSKKEVPCDRLALDYLCIFKNRCDCHVVGNIYDLPVTKTPKIQMEVDL